MRGDVGKPEVYDDFLRKALVPLRRWLRSKLLSLLLSQLLSLSLQLLTSRMLLSLLLALPQPWPPLLLSQV
jgi:hypothetical protein